MNEENLNIKYIREKTGLVENDELIPIILEIIQKSYKAGLCQAEYDNTMNLIEENQQLKEQLQQKEDVINKAKVDLEKHLNAKSYGNHKYELFDRKYLEEVLEILNNKGSNNE